jgi:TrkA domain protein
MARPTDDDPRLRSTRLPGVGERHEFSTADGETLGVVRHRDGDRELLLYSREDTDACLLSLRLTGKDARRLAALLGEGSVQRGR